MYVPRAQEFPRNGGKIIDKYDGKKKQNALLEGSAVGEGEKRLC
jgi:hypothetical protein